MFARPDGLVPVVVVAVADSSALLSAFSITNAHMSATTDTTNAWRQQHLQDYFDLLRYAKFSGGCNWNNSILHTLIDCYHRER